MDWSDGSPVHADEDYSEPWEARPPVPDLFPAHPDLPGVSRSGTSPPVHTERVGDHDEEAEQAARRWLGIVDWATLDEPDVEPIVEGLVFPGKWTHVFAGPGQGKSSFSLLAAVNKALGKPTWPEALDKREPLKVCYVDGENGPIEVRDKIIVTGYDVAQIPNLLYTDRAPDLTNTATAETFLRAMSRSGVRWLIIDGINSVIGGFAEKDDLGWRKLYANVIQPLTRAGVAVWTNDNTGKDHSKGDRGSTIKRDKATAVYHYSRIGHDVVRLEQTKVRSGWFAKLVEFSVVLDDDSDVIAYHAAAPREFTAADRAKADELDALKIPATASRSEAIAVMKAAGRIPGKTSRLVRAQQYRRQRRDRHSSVCTGGDVPDRETPGHRVVEGTAREHVEGGELQ